jgi:fructuronate reductase/mannitol 2-dehydrogenase
MPFNAVRPLNEATLGWHAARVAVPTYDRWSLTPGVVHVSVGSFHRSHQAVYFDDIASRGLSSEWGLVGVGLHRPAMRDALTAQDGLYTVVSRDPAGDSARIVQVMGRYLFAPENGEAVVAVLADPRTRLVTLTLTGGGYKVDAGTGRFAASDPAVQADLRGAGAPVTALGYLVAALDLRRRAAVAPFTVLSCDNLAGNGAIARRALVSFARLRDPALGDWIEENVAFPSSMVDRITPQTTVADRAYVAREFGVADRWPVMTEPFSQWIIEDDFCNGRPPLDEVGAQFVPDVAPYSMMKTRLLNASHCAIGYLGTLAGYRRIDEAVADPGLRGFLDAMMGDEVTPLLDPVPGIDLADYRRTLLARFGNGAVGDQLARLCRNGSSKVPAHLLSSVGSARRRGLPCERLVLAVAAWCRFLRGTDLAGAPLALDDPMASRLLSLALAGGTDPRPLLSERRVFGALADDLGFVSSLEAALVAIERDGVAAAVRAVGEAPHEPVAA